MEDKVTLRAARVNAGYTQAQAAQAIGVTCVTMIRYERGDRKISAVDFETLCTMYHMPINRVQIPRGEGSK